MEASLTPDQLKELLKAALVEVLKERRDLFRDLFRDLIEEALEEVALANAIEEGTQTELIERDQVFKLLEGEA